MKISILTLFPELFDCLRDYSIVSRAISNGNLEIDTVNIRDFAINKYGQVDDYSYGGGPGMLMMPGPIVDAIESVKDEDKYVIYLSAQGKPLNQKKLNELSKKKSLIFLNGHYEGIDNRVVENYVDEEISIGDFVLTGGEIASLVLVDGISRLLPGVLSSEDSYTQESHYNGLLEYPQYTRPKEFRGLKVPEILLSGDHEKIRRYRVCQSIKNTLDKRPDLINKINLSKEELDILSTLEDERR